MKALYLSAAASLIFLVPHGAQAAESYDNCTGYITTVPVTITTQGTWCLKSDVSASIASGAAITVGVNNVTLDCNNFKLGGLAAGTGTLAKGIHAKDRVGVTVRHCNIRGFHYGVLFEGGAGHVVENSAFNGNTFAGASATSVDNVIIRDSIFTDTGGSTVTSWPNPVQIVGGSAAIVTGNIITGVVPGGTSGNVDGIQVSSTARGAIVSGNRIFGLHAGTTGTATGITLSPHGKSMDNILDDLNSGAGGSSARGIFCLSGTASDQGIVRNTVVTRATNFWAGSCVDSGGNVHRS